MLSDLRELVGQELAPAEHQRRRQHERERREDAAHAPRVEAGKAEVAGRELVADDAGDQEAGNDEEHVDADEAAGHCRRESVEAEHREHGERTQAVYIRTIAVRTVGDHARQLSAARCGRFRLAP